MPPIAKPRSSEVDAHVGRRVRERRKALGMSQEKLADAIGLASQQVQKYEAGIDRVAASRLWDIARILEVDVAYFFESIVRRASRPRKAKPRKSPIVAKAKRRKPRKRQNKKRP